MAFTVTRSQPKRLEHLWDVVGQELCALDVTPTNAILSIWANISKECFQHLVESMPRRIKAALKAKGGQTQYINMVFL